MGRGLPQRRERRSHLLGGAECFGIQASAILSLATELLEEPVVARFEGCYRIAEIVEAIEGAASEGGASWVECRG
jgi:hypothetical protein